MHKCVLQSQGYCNIMCHSQGNKQKVNKDYVCFVPKLKTSRQFYVVNYSNHKGADKITQAIMNSL